MHIAIVDDELDNLDMLRRRLELRGFNVSTFDSGKAIIDALAMKKCEPSLILLDVAMPVMNGIDVLRQIRPVFHPPIVMLTASNDKDCVKQCIELGANDYILKPFNLDEVLNRVNKLIETKTQAKKKIQNLEQHLLDQKKNKQLNFEVLPDVGFKIINTLEEKDSSLAKIAEMVSADAALSSFVLKLANSPAMGQASSVSTVKKAVMVLGLQATANYLSLYLSRNLYDTNMPYLEKILTGLRAHSQFTAHIAKEMGRATGLPNSENLFAYGLTHDIGKLFLIHLIMGVLRKYEIEDMEQIEDVIDKLHVPFSETILRHWHFPHSFVEAVVNHHKVDFRQFSSPEPGLIALANLAAHCVNIRDEEQDAELSILPLSMYLPSLPTESLYTCVKKAREEYLSLDHLMTTD